jgi:hypothetical protein
MGSSGRAPFFLIFVAFPIPNQSVMIHEQLGGDCHKWGNLTKRYNALKNLEKFVTIAPPPS